LGEQKGLSLASEHPGRCSAPPPLSPGSRAGANSSAGEKAAGGKSSSPKFSPSLEQGIRGANRDVARGPRGWEKTGSLRSKQIPRF